MAHIGLTSDFNLKKPRGLIWTFKCDFNCDICAKSEHCSNFQKLPAAVLRPRSGQCCGLPVSEVYIFGLQNYKKLPKIIVRRVKLRLRGAVLRFGEVINTDICAQGIILPVISTKQGYFTHFKDRKRNLQIPGPEHYPR